MTRIIDILIRCLRESFHLFFGAGPCCRFTPCCSVYAREAIRVHGIGRGSLLLMRRLLRCRPFGAWGADPVPPFPAVRPNSSFTQWGFDHG